MFVYHEFERSDVCVSITKTGENLFVIAEVLIFLRRRGFLWFFCASNGFKMGDNPSSSGSLSSSSSSGPSSDSSSSHSVSSFGDTDPCFGTETGKMDECDDDVGWSWIHIQKWKATWLQIMMIIKVWSIIVLDCHCELYTKFPLMKSAFGKFAVSNSLFWCYNLY